MNCEWRVSRSVEVSDAVLAASSGRPITASILAKRGLNDPDRVRRFLDPAVYESTAPETLHDLKRAVERLDAAIKKKERILVWGDFDVDGQTATSVFMSALQGLGAKATYHIPVRAKESHGIKTEVLQKYIDKGIDLLLTCDTGIAAVEGVRLANEAGVDVVITDHHDLPAELPRAIATVNPKFHEQAEPNHPLRGLPGVGVAYKIVEALYTEADRGDELEGFLDLVALGIVTDLALQKDDTRHLLQRGLDAIRKTSRPGLLHLIQISGVEPEFLNDEDIGFQLGPRLNAVGRLADANVCVPLLTTTDSETAYKIARELEHLNEERKYETEVVYASALEQIDREPSLLQYAVLVMENAKWHPGVIGIVASRLVEEFGKPTILFSSSDNLVRGSARSLEGYHITEAIGTQVALLVSYGGHPMAAGLTLQREGLDAFRRGVSKAIIDQRNGRESEPVLEIEAEVPLNGINLDTAMQLELLAPFGPGNPPVNILCRHVRIANSQEIGKDESHLKLTIGDESTAKAEILWWDGAKKEAPKDWIDIVLRLRASAFRGKRTLTATLQDFHPARAQIDTIHIKETPTIVDCRNEVHPEMRLSQIMTEEQAVQVYGEATACKSAHSRIDMEESDVLVLWTVPPDRQVLRDILSVSKAERVYVFGLDSKLDNFHPFIRRFGGLVKYALEHYEGRTSIKALAASMGHTNRTIQCGLDFLPEIAVRAEHKIDSLVLKRCARVRCERIGEILNILLQESGAFRRTFRKAKVVAQLL